MARSFTSTNGIQATIPSGLNPSGFSAVTLAGWGKVTTASAVYQTVIASNVSDSAGIWFHSGKMAYYATAAGGHFLDPGSISVSAATWYHVAFSGVMLTGTATCYVNGAVDGTFTMPSSLNSAPSWFIGRDLGGSDFLTGSIADCAVWNAALTQLEIIALARGMRPPRIRPQSLTGYWPLFGLSSPEPDLSGNANNGVLTGTALDFGPPITLLSPRLLASLDQPPPFIPTPSRGTWIVNQY